MTGSRLKILGLIVAVIVVILALKNYEIWSGTNPYRAFRKEVKEAAPKSENRAAFLPFRERVPRTSILAIAEKNIFSPDRKEFAGQMVTEKEKPLPRPQVFLYGIVITDQFQAASVISPGRTLRKGERAMKTLKLGEKIEGYKLARIEADRITLEASGDSFEVLLFDPNAPKTRVPFRTETKVPGAAGSTRQPASPATTPSPMSTGNPPSAVPARPEYLPDPQRDVQPPPSEPALPGAVPDPVMRPRTQS